MKTMNTPAKLLLSTVLLTQAAIASADDSAAAAMKRGNAALKAGRVHEACQAFEASDKLAPSIDAELSLASCYEQDGKGVSAARLYRSIAERDTNATRRQTSLARAAKLEAKAPKLRFAINPNPPGLVIAVDGVVVSGTEDVRVDQGPHEVTATAPGFAGHASAPVDRDHGTIDVILRLEAVDEPQRATEPAPMPAPAPMATAPADTAPAAMPADPAGAPMPVMPAMPRDGGSSDHRMRNGVILGAAGVGLLVGAGVLFKLSGDKFDDEHALCPGSQCATPADLDKAKSLLSDGHTMRGLSIGMGIGGVIAVAAGTYFMVSPHHKESGVALDIRPGHTGITYSASF
jgi:hypothetical protein